MRLQRIGRVLYPAVVVLVLYWAVAMFAWCWRNPDLNQVQAIRHTWDALFWK